MINHNDMVTIAITWKVACAEPMAWTIAITWKVACAEPMACCAVNLTLFHMMSLVKWYPQQELMGVHRIDFFIGGENFCIVVNKNMYEKYMDINISFWQLHFFLIFLSKKWKKKAE